jgi:hypothetical protein
MWVSFIVGVMMVLLGCKGFTAEGLPVDSKKRMTGLPARIVGVFCILAGVFIMALPWLISKI